MLGESESTCAMEGGRPRLRLAVYAVVAAGVVDEDDEDEDSRLDVLLVRRSSFSRCCSAAWIAAATAGSRECFEDGEDVGSGGPSGMAVRELNVVDAVGVGGPSEEVELAGDDVNDDTDDRFALPVLVR